MQSLRVFVLQSLIVLYFHVVREDDALYSFFTYDRNCSSGVAFEPEVDCVVHPTMMCNGVQNCPNCTDEIYEECMRAHCKEGNHT